MCDISKINQLSTSTGLQPVSTTVLSYHVFTPSVHLAVPEAAVETTPFKTDVDTTGLYSIVV